MKLSYKTSNLAVTLLFIVGAGLSGTARAAIIYEFDFTNIDSGTYADFSLTLTYPDYVTTTGMAALSGPPLPTPLGYSVAYAGTNNKGFWLFDDNNGAGITDSALFFDADTFYFVPSGLYVGYFSSPGTYAGFLYGYVASQDIYGDASLTITDTLATSVPEPSTLALLGMGLAGLGFVRRKSRA